MGTSNYAKCVKALKEPPKVDRAFWEALGGGLARNRVKGSEAAEMRFLKLDMCLNTYSSRKEVPETFTLKELRQIVKQLDLTSEQCGKFLGCKE